MVPSNFNYDSQQKVIVDYLKKTAKHVNNFSIGVEFEHIIVDKNSLLSIPYKDGIDNFIMKLSSLGWNIIFEENYPLGAFKNENYITLEPGGQFEISFGVYKNLDLLEKEYLSTMNELQSLADTFNFNIMPVGYHPKSKILDLDLLPKRRYKIMFDYFKNKGKYAHNMMKGTASIQICLDYFNEEDFSKKIKVAYFLAPLLTTLIHNTPYFEGEKSKKLNTRSLIWNNCDHDRCGLIPGVFDNVIFRYSDYADYLLNTSPIIVLDDNNNLIEDRNKLKYILDPNNWTDEQIFHILGMVFPDVRAKGYLELRFLDAIPYPSNIAYVRLIKELFYNQDNLEKLYQMTLEISDKDYNKIYREIDTQFLKARYGNFHLYQIKDVICSMFENTKYMSWKSFLPLF